MVKFELAASVALWRGDEILVMKRESGTFAGGGWFLPGGHLEQGERPAEAAARELFEEAGIALDPAALTLVDVMTYVSGEVTAHLVIYNAEAPADAEAALNEEHVLARWMTAEAYIARFLDTGMLRARGVPETMIAISEEVARVVREAARQWRGEE